MEHQFTELKNALIQLRNVFIKKLANQSEIEKHKLFLRTMVSTEPNTWTVPDAYRLYQLIKGYEKKLALIGYNFNKVQQVQLTQDVTKPIHQTTKIENVVGYDGNRFLVRFYYTQTLYDQIKAIKGREWLGNEKMWTLPLSASKELKEFAERNKFDVGEAAQRMLNNVTGNLENSYSAEYIELNLPLKKELYGYQTVGVKYLADNRFAICGDQMRLGKTPQSIGAVLMTNTFPCITIAPKSLLLNWKNEWQGWTNKRVIILDKKNITQLPYLIENDLIDVAITNYDGIQTFFISEINEVEITKGDRAGTSYKTVKTNGLEQLFKSVILDEAHNCRNKRTLRYKCIKKVFDGKNAKYALTGTPIVKGPQDFVALLEMIGMIDHFGGAHKFMKVYKDMDKKFLNTADDKDLSKQKASMALRELNIKLRSLCFIRRERWQVPNSTPEKFRTMIKVELDNRAEYDHAEFSLQSYLAENGASAEKISNALRAELLVRYNMLKQISARGKISALIEHVEQVVLEGEKIIVGCWYNDTVQVLKDKLKQFNPVTICGRIDGRDMKTEDIEANKLKFNTNADCSVIIITYGKGSEGHNLGAANHCAIIEQGWTYKDQGQLEDRAVVVGKKNDLLVTYFLGQDTLDEHVYNIIESRRKVEKEGTGGQEEVETTFKALTSKLLQKIG